jgi:hypothetical protein
MKALFITSQTINVSNAIFYHTEALRCQTGKWYGLQLNYQQDHFTVTFQLNIYTGSFKNSILTLLLSARSQDSIVSLANGYELDDRGVRVQVPVESRIFSPLCRPDRLFPRGKAAGCEADHSPPASAKVMKMWIYTSTPPYALMV